MFCLRLAVLFVVVQWKIKPVTNATPNIGKDRMTPDYSPRFYKSSSLNRKRHIVDAMLEDLHEQYFSMIERALEHSDMQQARDVIEYVQAL